MDVWAGREFRDARDIETVPWEKVHRGTYDPDERLNAMNRDGIHASVLYPNFSRAFVGMWLTDAAPGGDLQRRQEKPSAESLAPGRQTSSVSADRKSDVFLHNVRAESAHLMQIDYGSLLAHNPRLVYASISGFSTDGPYATRPGLDPVGLARSGMMAVLSGGSDKAPVLPPLGMADHMAGILAAFGVLAALIARDKTHAPQRVESSLLGGAMWLGQLNLQYSLFSGKELLPLDTSSDPLLNSYRCADGHWIFIAAPSERSWPALCAELGMETLALDPRFDSFEARWANRVELRRLLEERFAGEFSSQWAAQPCAEPWRVFEIVRRPTEIGVDAQVLANRYVVETEHPEIGLTWRIALPLHVNGAACSIDNAAPAHEQHTEEVLMSLAG
jgi:crotonobetainyl-CoA:carnitine CoA-transferase CaiB-like acyl-CoA transferase